MRRIRAGLIAGTVFLALAMACGAHAEPTVAEQEARIEKLEAALQSLQAELGALKRERAQTAIVSAPTGAAPAPPVRDEGFAANTPTSAGSASIISGHPAIQSGDGRFTANLLGVMQFDAAGYFQSKPGGADLRRGAAAGDTAHAQDLSDGTNFRRARIGIGGKAFGDFEYNLLYEFGGAGEEDAGHIQEAWFQYSGLKPLHFRVGAFSPFIGMEDVGSTNGMLFPERPDVSDIARSLAGGDFREGAQIVANTDRWLISGAVTGRLVGVVNSSGSGVAQPFDSQLGYVGRAAFVPFRGKDYLVHLGLHGSYVAKPADITGPGGSATATRYPIEFRERPELRVDGTRLIDTGAIDASHAFTEGAEAAGVWRNFFLQAEYEHIGIDRRNPAGTVGLTNPRFTGFYVEGSWIITGEQRKYNTGNFAFDGPPVAHNFSLKDGTWGAFELALRYSDIDLNYHQGAAGTAPATDAVRGGEQEIFSTGVNWYLNPIIRLMFDYQHVKVDRLSPNATTFLTPVGAQVGQSYDVLLVRSQIAF